MRLIETCGVNAENVGAALRGCPAMNFSLAAFRSKQVSHAGLPIHWQTKIRTILATMLIATIVAQTTGCTGCERLEETYYDFSLGGGGVMNDSMALISRCRTDYYFTDGMNGGERFEKLGCNLLLVDIRFEKIYWEKEIPTKYGVGLGTILDSVLFFYNGDSYSNVNDNGLDYWWVNMIATQRLDNENFQHSERIELKPKKIDLVGEGHKYLPETRVRPWQYGLLLAKLGNKYALLDTVAGTMEMWQPAGEFEWLNDCADAKWSSVGGLCLKSIPDTLGFVLLRNGADTLAIRYLPYELPFGDGTYDVSRPLIFAGNSIISNRRIYLMSRQGQISKNPLDVWIYTQMVFFKDLHGNEVNYDKKIVY